MQEFSSVQWSLSTASVTAHWMFDSAVADLTPRWSGLRTGKRTSAHTDAATVPTTETASPAVRVWTRRSDPESMLNHCSATSFYTPVTRNLSKGNNQKIQKIKKAGRWERMGIRLKQGWPRATTTEAQWWAYGVINFLFICSMFETFFNKMFFKNKRKKKTGLQQFHCKGAHCDII